jgi:hypothetical protein|tara:strand:- start:1387 stop:1644 length:258 start_codon:yes stop_codon:yes gene_type:complete
MKQAYYIIAKDQITGSLKYKATYSKQEAEDTRKQWRVEYNDVVILTAMELVQLSKGSYINSGDVVTITDVDDIATSRDNTPIGTL